MSYESNAMLNRTPHEIRADFLDKLLMLEPEHVKKITENSEYFEKAISMIDGIVTGKKRPNPTNQPTSIVWAEQDFRSFINHYGKPLGEMCGIHLLESSIVDTRPPLIYTNTFSFLFNRLFRGIPRQMVTMPRQKGSSSFLKVVACYMAFNGIRVAYHVESSHECQLINNARHKIPNVGKNFFVVKSPQGAADFNCAQLFIDLPLVKHRSPDPSYVEGFHRVFVINTVENENMFTVDKEMVPFLTDPYPEKFDLRTML